MKTTRTQNLMQTARKMTTEIAPHADRIEYPCACFIRPDAYDQVLVELRESMK